MGKGHLDKIAVITGAAAGIGQAFAKRLAQDGAHVVIADLNLGTDTMKLVEAAGRQAMACICDVASPELVQWVCPGYDIAGCLKRADTVAKVFLHR